MIVPSFGDEPLSKNVPENGDHEIALTSHHTNTSNSDNNCMGTLETFDIIDPVRDLALLNVDDSSSVVHDDDEILNHDVIKDSCKKVDSFDAGSATNNISNVNIECSNVGTFETIVQLDNTSVTVEDLGGVCQDSILANTHLAPHQLSLVDLQSGREALTRRDLSGYFW